VEPNSVSGEQRRQVGDPKAKWLSTAVAEVVFHELAPFTPTERLVACAIGQRLNNESRDWRISAKDMAKRTGLSIRSVQGVLHDWGCHHPAPLFLISSSPDGRWNNANRISLDRQFLARARSMKFRPRALWCGQGCVRRLSPDARAQAWNVTDKWLEFVVETFGIHMLTTMPTEPTVEADEEFGEPLPTSAHIM
jgi:hypothetical protein